MRKKDKLYTLSKYSADRINKEANLFPIGGLLNPFSTSLNIYPSINSRIDYANSSYNNWLNKWSTPDYIHTYKNPNAGPFLPPVAIPSAPEQAPNRNIQDPFASSIGTVAPNTGLGKDDLSYLSNYATPLINERAEKTDVKAPKWKQAIGAIGGIAGGVGGKLIGGGYSTGGVGEGITGVGNAVASFMPDPVTKGLVAFGSGILGGLVNRGFGVKRNDKNIASIKANTGELRSAGNQMASATTNESFMDAAANMGGTSGFKGTDLVKGGWFAGGKAAREANKYLSAEKQALAYQTHAMAQGAQKVDKIQDDNVMANFAAEGGWLNNGNMGALEYGLALDAINARRQKAQIGDKISTNPFGALANDPLNVLASGGKIHIKHPGRLTALKKRTGKTEAELWAEGKPEVRRMITFARNARKWKKAYGGFLDAADNLFALGGDVQMHGGDYSNGSTHIDAGNSHEENPYQGVQVGVDQEGTPNLVEENEVIFNDYVYSQRIELDDEAKEKFHFSKKQDITYADAAKKLEKEISERPNDPISKAAFEHQMSTLAEEQERQKQEMQAEEAREAFEALSPEEQVEVMQNAEAQEQQAAEEEAMAQEQAMQEQAAMQGQPMDEQMMQEQMAQQGVPMEQGMPMGIEAQMAPQMAYGGLMGNQYGLGGMINMLKDGGYTDVLAWVKKNLKVGAKDATWIARAIWQEAQSNKSNYYRPQGTSMFGNNKDAKYAWDYGMAYKALLPKTTSGREKSFNKLVKSGMPRNLAFSLAYPNSGADAVNPELIQKRNEAYQRLVAQPQQTQAFTQEKVRPSAGYRGADGKLYSTLEEANAAGNNRQTKISQTPTAQPPTGANVTFAGLNGTKKSWEEESKGWNKKQSSEQKVPTQQPVVEQPAVVSPEVIDYSNTYTQPSKKSVTPKATYPKAAKAQEKKAGMNAGSWKEGDSSSNWANYSKVGLQNYMQDVVNRINAAPDDAAKNQIRQEAIATVGKIQNAYRNAYQENLSPTDFRDVVKTLQTEFQNVGGNAGFDKISDNINIPNGARNKDVASNNYTDGLWGPRTSIRNWGSTEYGTENDAYYKDIADLATQAGMVYGPNKEWTYGNPDNPYQLYGLSMADGSAPANAPRTIHQMVGGDQLPDDQSKWVGVGDVVGEPITLDDGTIVIQHAPAANAQEAQAKAAEAAAMPQPTGQGDANGDGVRDVAPVIRSEWPRYAGLMGPAVGLGMMAAGIGKPNLRDYEAALDIVNKGASLASYMPIGNYLKYQPMDIWAEQNRMDANTRATDRALLNNSSPVGTRNAGLVANNYASQLGSGNLYRNALQYNDQLMQNVGTFNRATDMFNAEAFNRTSATNAEIRNRDRQLRAQLNMQTAAEKAAANAGWYNSLYGNVSGLFKGISDLGRENAQRNMISRLAAAGAFGALTPENAVGAGLVQWKDEADKKKKKNWLSIFG